MVTPDKEHCLVPRRTPAKTPGTAPSHKNMMSLSRSEQASNAPSKNETSGASKNLMLLFNQNSTVHKDDYPTNVRHLIYSYLDRSTVLQKISILSTSERAGLVDSETAAENKSYRIEIAGQRNA